MDVIDEAVDYLLNAFEGPLIDQVNRDWSKTRDEDYVIEQCYNAYRILRKHQLESVIDAL